MKAEIDQETVNSLGSERPVWPSRFLRLHSGDIHTFYGIEQKKRSVEKIRQKLS